MQDDPYFSEIYVLCRKEWSGSAKKLKVYPALFSPHELDKFTPLKIDFVFCCLGTTIKVARTKEAFRLVDRDWVVNLAQWSNKSRVKKFLVVSSLGANSSSPLFYSRTKGEMEDGVKAAGILSTMVARPSLLIGKRKIPRKGERFGEVALALTKPLLIGPFQKYKAIEGQTVAKALVHLSKLPSQGFRVFESHLLAELAKSPQGV